MWLEWSWNANSASRYQTTAKSERSVTSQHLSFSRRIFTARMRFQSVRHERWPADAKWISDIASNTIETRISTVFTVAPAVSSAVPGYPAASSSSLICSRPNYMMGFPPSVAKKSRALDTAVIARRRFEYRIHHDAATTD